MAFPAIQWQRRTSAAFAPPGTRLTRPGGAGVVTGLPLVLLRSEGVALLAMAAVLYGKYKYGRSWWLLAALVWFARIGMDRALGLGPQYPDGFGPTHLRGTRRGRDHPGSGSGAWTG
jgi:hypothetical protein